MFSRRNIAILFLVLVAVVAIILGFQKYKEGKRLSGAAYAVEMSLQALQNQNVAAFTKYVDLQKVSESILAQVLEEPTEETSKGTGFWGAVKTLGDSLSNRLTGYIRPELAHSLNRQILSYVENGKFTESYDLTNLYGRKPMLQKIWYDLAGDTFVFKGLSDIHENKKRATFNINFYRKDLDFSSSITLKLHKTEGAWQVISVQGLGQILKQLDQLRIKIIKAKNKEIQNKINKSLIVRSIEKSTGVAKGEFGGKRVLLRIAFENIGTEDIKSFHASITFKNKEGKALRRVTIKDTDIILVGDIVEKSWPMAINPLSADDNFIFRANQDDIIMESHIHSLILSSGDKLEMIKQEK